MPYSHVVNGFMFCLIGLWDLHQVGQIAEAKELHDQGVDTLINLIPAWKLPYWSKYDLFDLTSGGRVNLSTRHYHFLHIDQLTLLHRQAGWAVLEETRGLFARQVKRWSSAVRIYANKARTMARAQ